ncbi:MAG: VOC family protein [Alphaproteobacteria bacterium]
MKLGAFSISLAVKDIQASKAFYARLGFQKVGGDEDQGWLVLSNDSCTIGLFQGMFDKNTLTFNPGWNQQGQPLDSFQDIRDLQKHLKSQGVSFVSEADETGSGPASFVLLDPDGNPILVDQHV